VNEAERISRNHLNKTALDAVYESDTISCSYYGMDNVKKFLDKKDTATTHL